MSRIFSAVDYIVTKKKNGKTNSHKFASLSTAYVV